MICMQCGAETPYENRPCAVCGRIPTSDYPSQFPPIDSSQPTAPSVLSGEAMGAFPPPAGVSSWAAAGVAAPNAATVAPAPLVDSPPYKPSGRSGPGGLALLFLTALVVGPIVGVAYDKISGFFNIFLISPLIAGLVVGGAMYGVVKKTKVRNVLAAAGIAVFAGLLTAGTNYASSCLALRPMIVSAFSQELADEYHVPLTQATAKVDRKLGLISELRIASRYKALSGVSITSTHDYSHTGGTPIQGNFYYALEIFEALLISGAAAAVAAGAASALFCEECRDWYTTHKLFRVHPSRSAPMLQYVKAQDWSSAAALPATAPGTDKNHCDVVVKRCPGCRQSRIEVATVSEKASKKLFSATLPPEASARLVELGRLPQA